MTRPRAGDVAPELVVPRVVHEKWLARRGDGSRDAHADPRREELDRLEAVMYIRPLYLVGFGYRRAVTNGVDFNEWGFIEPPEYFSATAAAARAAFNK